MKTFPFHRQPPPSPFLPPFRHFTLHNSVSGLCFLLLLSCTSSEVSQEEVGKGVENTCLSPSPQFETHFSKKLFAPQETTNVATVLQHCDKKHIFLEPKSV